MSRPLLLDLFCGAGGCSVGYYRAGFDVVGVDIKPHPDYPYPFRLSDAMDVLRATGYLSQFDVIHASPPCPAYSQATHINGGQSNRANHPDLVEPVIVALDEWAAETGGTWIVENVPGAPMPVDSVLICGQAMGLRHIARHRIFASNQLLMSPGCACDGRPTVSVTKKSAEDRRGTPTHYQSNGRPVFPHASKAEVRELMGVEWMNNREDVGDSIPPAYTEYLGLQLLDHVRAGAA